MSKFKPGQSGNPGGRPKIISEIQELARKHTAEAIETLVAVMRDTSASPAARVSAASAVIDRAAGKPVQAIEASGSTRPASELSDDELAAIITGEQERREEEEDEGKGPSASTTATACLPPA